MVGRRGGCGVGRTECLQYGVAEVQKEGLGDS